MRTIRALTLDAIERKAQVMMQMGWTVSRPVYVTWTGYAIDMERPTAETVAREMWFQELMRQ